MVAGCREAGRAGAGAEEQPREAQGGPAVVTGVRGVPGVVAVAGEQPREREEVAGLCRRVGRKGRGRKEGTLTLGL